MIILKDITKAFGSQKILQNVNLSIEKGQKTVVLGQNGAGKSSLMRIILGEFKPNSGEVRVNGFDPLTARRSP